MSTLVKLGGTLLDAAGLRQAVSEQIAGVWQADPDLVVVHGGGKQMTRFLAEKGIESRFSGGLRVTTPDVMDGVLKVFAGSVNKELVASLSAAGCNAVGVSGVDGRLALAEQLNPELGQVGRIVAADARLLNVLIQGGFLPVVACVAAGSGGTVYNVNADQMAVACAAAMKAAALIFLTDVDGVRGGDGKVIPQLTAAQARQLIAEGIATGGMEAKLKAAAAALDEGVEEVRIAPGAAPRVLSQLRSGVQLGTKIRK